MRIALADDSAIIRSGLTRLFEGAGVEVRYAAKSGDELLAFMAREQPDAIVVDVRMPPDFTDEGLQAAERIKELYPQVGVLVLSTYGETAYAIRLMSIPAAGVGYLLKDRVDDVGTLVEALERVTSGRAAVDPEIVGQMFQRQASQGALEVLTDRERKVLELMAEGRSNAGISQAINISHRTVETYVAKVFTKLRISSDTVANRRVLAVLVWLSNTGPTTY